MSSIDQQQIADTAADTDAASSPSAQVMDPLFRSATDDENSSADARAPAGAHPPDKTASTSADTRCPSTSTDDPYARFPDKTITSSVDTNCADATVAPSTGTGCPSTAPASASAKISKGKVPKPLFRIASVKLYELFTETGLSRQECKTLWHEVYDRILDRKRVLYFSKESTAEEKALCREEIVQNMMAAMKTWSSTTCRWSDQLVLDDDKIASFIIEQKIKGLVDHAVTCFQISLDTLIRTGSQWFWLYQDEVSKR